MKKLTIVFLITTALVAQDKKPPAAEKPLTIAELQDQLKYKDSLIAWYEQQVSTLRLQIQTVTQYYNNDQRLTGLTNNPPKPPVPKVESKEEDKKKWYVYS